MSLFAREVFIWFSLVGSCCVKTSRFLSISDPIPLALCIPFPAVMVESLSRAAIPTYRVELQLPLLTA